MMISRTRVCLVVTTPGSMVPPATELDAGTVLELRADRLGDSVLVRSGSDDAWCHLYTLRSRSQGGTFEGTADERARRLTAAASHVDLVDLEFDRDLRPEVLTKVPPERRVISWTPSAVSTNELIRVHRQMLRTPAALYRLAPRVPCASAALNVLRFLRSIDRSDTVAFGDGPAGFWTRILAPRLGSPWLVADLDGDMAWSRVFRDYGAGTSAPLGEIYGIVGARAMQSFSPRLHNAVFRAQRPSALFVPFPEADFEAFWQVFGEGRGFEELGLRLNGLTVASPHKRTAAQIVARRAPIVRRAASSNLLVRRGAGWFSGTTDPLSALPLLRQCRRTTRGLVAAVVGCGGAGRAIAAALDSVGAHVTLVNRSRDRGRFAATLLGLSFVPLAEFVPDPYDVVVNATPIGSDGHGMAFDPTRLGRGGAIVDLVYANGMTPLVAAARASGRLAVDGMQVLMAQVRGQSRAMTGLDMRVGDVHIASVERPTLDVAMA